MTIKDALEANRETRSFLLALVSMALSVLLGLAITTNSGRLDRLEQRLELVRDQTRQLEVRVGVIETHYEDIDHRLSRIEEKLDVALSGQRDQPYGAGGSSGVGR